MAFDGFVMLKDIEGESSDAKQLNGRINLYKLAGRYATWYVPAVIGIYDVFSAAPGARMRIVKKLERDSMIAECNLAMK